MDNMSSHTAVALSEIRAGLARHSLTQEQLAAKLEVSRTAVGNRLKGKVPFTVDELTITAEFIRVPMVDLLSSSPLSAAPQSADDGALSR